MGIAAAVRHPTIRRESTSDTNAVNAAPDQVRRPCDGRVGLRGDDPPAAPGDAQPVVAHEALDLAARHRATVHATFSAQLQPHLTGSEEPAAASAVVVHAAGLGQHSGGAHSPGRGRAGPGGVVARRGDRHAVLSEHAADRPDPEPVSVIVDERGHHGSRGSSSRAKKLDAASRISLARLSSRFSASSSLILFASVVVMPGCWPRRYGPACTSHATCRARSRPAPRSA